MGTNDTDAMTTALRQAAEQLRTALHAVQDAWVDPASLYARAGELVSVFSRANGVAMALLDQVETAGVLHQLGSDNDTPATEHLDRASGLLLRSAAEADDARRLADEARNALSHLKLDKA